MFESIEIAGKTVDKDSLRFEGSQVVDGRLKDGTDLTDKQLQLLTQMNEIEDLV